MQCSASKTNGQRCKGKAADGGPLCKYHAGTSKQPLTEPVVIVEEAAAPSAIGEPAILEGMRRTPNLSVGIKGVTMLRPICHACQRAENVQRDWYASCDHEPYVQQVEKRTPVPIYSEPRADGSVVVEKMEEQVTWTPHPNVVDVIQEMVANSGMGVEKARAKGYILPTELVSPLYPHGIAAFCEFRGCRSQTDLKRYKFGTFCREVEARLVGMRSTDANGNLVYGAREVGTMNPGKTRAQLEKVDI